MNILLFGATGMIGQGVLRECLLDPRVDHVTTIGRQRTGQAHPKLREIEHNNLFDYTAIEDQLQGFDACFFCLGISSNGLSEEKYRRITYGITLAAGIVLAKHNRNLTFVFVSGRGTDSTEKGRIMWARVKGAAENALLRLPFKAVYLFRPGVIQPLHGIQSRTRLYRFFYILTAPLFPVLKALFPKQITTTEKMGRAMINAVEKGYSKKYLENPDINELAES